MSRRERFYIAQIEEEKKPERKPSKYVSPYSGTQAKDNLSYPYVQYGNGGKQYNNLDKNKNDQDELNNVIVENETPEQMRKRLAKEDKYSPDRIPSYYRKEENLGISSSHLADLRGDKLSNEEILERNRQQYGRFYHEAMREIDNKKANQVNNQVSSKVEEKQVERKQLQDPLNSIQYDYIHEEDFSLDANENQDNEEVTYNNSNSNPNYNSSRQTVSNNVRSEQINQDVDFFHLNDAQSSTNYRSNNSADNLPKSSYQEEVDYDEPMIEEHIIRSRPKVVEVQNDKNNIFFGNAKIRYVAPPFEILQRNGKVSGVDSDEINYQSSVINRTLEEFKVGGRVIACSKGPAVTQYEIKLDPGVNVNKVVNIQKNLQMNLASGDIRIEAPIFRKPTVGIEVPNYTRDMVLFGDLINNQDYLRDGKPLNIILGLNNSGQPQYADIAKMPHCLIAGMTGGGKSVCLFSIIFSIIYKSSPEEVKMILVDPKGNELVFFKDIPHLATPIIKGYELVAPALKWTVDEMERRYEFLAAHSKRTVEDYNKYAKANGLKIIPYIVVLIDEFGDLMTYIADEFETYVLRLAQKARSAGIHVIIATQRPTVDVIRGSIKANIASRIAFTTSTAIDSQTILDRPGAEKLLKNGDMLSLIDGKLTRVQGTYISQEELDAIQYYYEEQAIPPKYMFTHEELKTQAEADHSNSTFAGNSPFEDEYFEDVARFVFRQRKASANQIQKTFNIGFNRADKIIVGLSDLGIIESENVPGRARAVIIDDIDVLENLLSNRF